MPSGPTLSTRALNRATLDRQLLLRRHDMPPAAVIEALAGLQAQAPNAPYVGLWTRLGHFDPDELAGLIVDRLAVRGTLMRGTVHLVTVEDYVAFRPLLQPVVRRSLMGQFGGRIEGTDLDAVLAFGRELLGQRPHRRGEVRELLERRWPGADAEALSYAVLYLLPNLQVPPRGVWGRTGPAAFVGAESWLGRRLGEPAGPDGLFVRYLAAFGPAGADDAQTWSGLTRLREVADRLRPRLRTFRDESGRELFDLPDAPRPDPDTPAPPRFLPEYDNVLLSHADRSRVIDDPSRRVPLPPGNGGTRGTVLVDGTMRATWAIDAEFLRISPFDGLSAAERDDVTVEAERLLPFAGPGTARQIVVD